MKNITKILLLIWFVILPLGILLDIQHTLVEAENALSNDYYIITSIIETFCLSLGLLIGYELKKWKQQYSPKA